jgi:hypothetical protein
VEKAPEDHRLRELVGDSSAPVEPQCAIVPRNLLLKCYGVGGLTKGVAFFECLLRANAGEYVLLCIPYSKGKQSLYENYRKYYSKNNDRMVCISYNRGTDTLWYNMYNYFTATTSL